MKLTATILGCGSSGGVPRIGNQWGACDPSDPRNRRLRCSLLLTRHGPQGTTRVLIDTSPDLRAQMLAADVDHLDAVFITHEHADHTHGIDELRAFYLRARQRVPVWADETTGSLLMSRFGYCFYSAPGSDYPPIADLNRLHPGVRVEVGGKGGAISLVPFILRHGNIDALGFRIDEMAYTPDLNGIPDDSRHALKDLGLWIVDALRITPHPSHFHLSETLEWIEHLRPRRAILTNLHIDLDYGALSRLLPAEIVPAHDGMTVEVPSIVASCSS
jgi:phosphoribosyl 1,2-cyclic phosphate phosphodiesterase